METPRVGHHISRRTYARRLSPSDLRRPLPDLCAHAKRPLAGRHRAPAWRCSLDDQARAGSQHRREGLSLQTGAGEGVAKTQNSLMCATQDEAGSRNIDRGKTDAGAVEPPIRSAAGWRKMATVRSATSASTSMFGKTRKTAETFMSSCVTTVKNTTSGRAKPQAGA